MKAAYHCPRIECPDVQTLVELRVSKLNQGPLVLLDHASYGKLNSRKGAEVTASIPVMGAGLAKD